MPYQPVADYPSHCLTLVGAIILICPEGFDAVEHVLIHGDQLFDRDRLGPSACW